MDENSALPPRISSAKISYNGAGQPVDYFMAIVCTDRSQHKKIRLTTARRMLTGERGMSRALERFAPPMRDAQPHSMVGRDSYTFVCPLCTRTPQITRERWWEIVEEFARAGLGELDISLLP
ncbi:hypothetical protein [Longispora urticae]